LAGFDFSAYRIALEEIAARSPGADVIVMNDSNFGPFTDLRPFLAASAWALTGFTASTEFKNHIQSYAFIMRDVTSSRLRSLRTVLFPWIVFDRWDLVIEFQELRLARIAARHMPVGAFWFADQSLSYNPTLIRPFDLLAAGHPFLKRSLLTKHSSYQSVGDVRDALRSRGHPV
jgi:lipopolysaccharide biosynthesis protein